MVRRKVVRKREEDQAMTKLLKLIAGKLATAFSIFFLLFIGVVLVLCAKRDLLLIADLLFGGTR
jgi:hypothetical protein